MGAKHKVQLTLPSTMPWIPLVVQPDTLEDDECGVTSQVMTALVVRTVSTINRSEDLINLIDMQMSDKAVVIKLKKVEILT